MSIGYTNKTSEPVQVQIFHDSGRKKLKPLSDRWYQHVINQYEIGEKLTLTITSKKLKRTDAQNNYLWGVYYPAIMKETGEDDIEALHELFKGLFLTKEIREIKVGKKVEKVRIKGSTTNLSVSEFSEFVMKVESYTGIEAPPAEQYGLLSLKPTLI